jgi:hypothetical protein
VSPFCGLWTYCAAISSAVWVCWAKPQRQHCLDVPSAVCVPAPLPVGLAHVEQLAGAKAWQWLGSCSAIAACYGTTRLSTAHSHLGPNSIQLSQDDLCCLAGTCAWMQELRFGDNDTLAAQVAALVQADWLFLMTDVDHLYTANPKVGRRQDLCGGLCVKLRCTAGVM